MFLVRKLKKTRMEARRDDFVVLGIHRPSPRVIHFEERGRTGLEDFQDALLVRTTASSNGRRRKAENRRKGGVLKQGLRQEEEAQAFILESLSAITGGPETMFSSLPKRTRSLMLLRRRPSKSI